MAGQPVQNNAASPFLSLSFLHSHHRIFYTSRIISNVRKFATITNYDTSEYSSDETKVVGLEGSASFVASPCRCWVRRKEVKGRSTRSTPALYDHILITLQISLPSSITTYFTKLLYPHPSSLPPSNSENSQPPPPQPPNTTPEPFHASAAEQPPQQWSRKTT